MGPTPAGRPTSNTTIGWAYGYDDFSRIASSNKNSGAQTFSYKYDRFGNRLQQNAPQGGPAPQYIFDANNRISGSGVLYDAAGNITNDGLGNTYTYDAENRLITVSGAGSASYVYDAMGRRVQTTVGSNQYGFIYDQNGHLLTTTLGGGWVNSEIYAGGLHVGTYGTNTWFEHSDWQGTVRDLSDATGVSAESCIGLPFGDASTCWGMNASAIHFTGDVHDAESNLEHTWFRQLSTTQGRWSTPDPAGMAAVDPTNPQSWNRYAYVGNNPLGATDPLGLDEGCFPDDPFCNPCDPWIFCFPPVPGGPLPPGPPPGPPPPPPTPDQRPRVGGNWPNGETLGLPTGMNLKPMSLAEPACWACRPAQGATSRHLHADRDGGRNSRYPGQAG